MLLPLSFPQALHLLALASVVADPAAAGVGGQGGGALLWRFHSFPIKHRSKTGAYDRAAETVNTAQRQLARTCIVSSFIAFNIFLSFSKVSTVVVWIDMDSERATTKNRKSSRARLATGGVQEKDSDLCASRLDRARSYELRC